MFADSGSMTILKIMILWTKQVTLPILERRHSCLYTCPQKEG